MSIATNQLAKVIEALQALGFTGYEARAYLALLEGGALNGYEIAKASGIPRANVYPVIERLVQRGVALPTHAPDATLYAAVPPRDLLRQLAGEQRRAVHRAREALAGLSARRAPEAVYNLKDEALIPAAERLIDGCRQRLLVAIQPPEAAILARALRAARERGVEITTLCLEACERECGGCQGEIHRHALAPGGERRWLLLVADDTQALIAECRAGRAQAVLTHQPLVVELTAAYIRQSLTLAVLGSELAGKYEGLLSLEARRLLERLPPAGELVASQGQEDRQA